MYDIRHLNDNEISVRAGDAAFPVPFREGLLYSSPARGTWTIAHTSMLIPGSHQIFVCPSCCLRGVVLSAEEMGAMDRFSMLEFTDDHILRGDLEDMIIEGVSGILDEMPKKPTCVLLYTSCVQHFLNIDLNLVYRECAKAHPEVDFIDCYMLPTMRKHFSPEKMQWRQLYRAVKKLPEDAHLANVIGSFYEIQPESELFEIFREAGVRVNQLPTMVSYDEYKHMGAAAMNVFFHPVVDFAAKDMEKRLGQKAVYMPVSFNYEEIRRSEINLAEALREIRLPDYDALQKEAEEALAGALDVIGQTQIALDFSAVTRPLSLARMLLEHGFCVRRIYADAFAPEEKGDFEVIRERFPDVKIFPMTQPGMRVAGRNAEQFLAIGQKATYFTGTRHFVNLVENGGLYGFKGIVKIARMMIEAFETEKNPRDFIEIKALGCAENCARLEGAGCGNGEKLAGAGCGNGGKRTDAGCGNDVILADDSCRNDRTETSGGRNGMRIVKRVLSTYSADNFGVCSALYELGGLVVMHDASGCNSTYNTHDEPRWYDMDSMVFISGLTEKDAIFGNDEILVRNLCETAEKLHPKFVCICGGPLPHIIGTDFRAVAKAVSRKTNLPCFGIQTNGMDAYTSGAGEAFACLVDLMENVEPGSRKKKCVDGDKVPETITDKSEKSTGGLVGCESNAVEKIKVNLLGATPLDFSLNGSVQAIQELLEDHGFAVRSTWAMGDTLDNILSSGDADVDLVISATGFAAAKKMRERFGIPYVIGCPVGRAAADRIVCQIREAAWSQSSICGSNAATGTQDMKAPNADIAVADAVRENDAESSGESHFENGCDTFEILLIGEPVMMKSMAETLKANGLLKSDEDGCGKEKKLSVRIISPMRGLPHEIAEGTDEIVLEDELREACRRADLVIADPLYARLLPEEQDKFIKLPHVAYSGRFYEKEIPVLVGERLDMWLAENVLQSPAVRRDNAAGAGLSIV